MELFFLYASIISASLLIISIFYFRKSNASSPSKLILPPGKMGLPFIGETLEFVSTSRNGIPEKFLTDRITRYSSQVFKTSLLGQPMALFCSAAGNKFLFTNENKLVTSWYPSSIHKIFNTTVKTEKFIEPRKWLVPNFLQLPSFLKPEALQRYIGIMGATARRHFESDWEWKQQVTLLPLLKKYNFLVACKVFLGIEDPNQVAKLSKTFDLVVSAIISVPINLPGTTFHRGIKASKAIKEELLAIIRQRKIDLAEKRASPTQDFLSHMLVTTNGDGEYMSEFEIADKALGLFVGSTDTASTAMAFTVKYLARLPHIYDEVLHEQMEIADSKKPRELLNWNDIQRMKHTWNVVCEVMRIAPPGLGGFKEAIKDFSFAGFTIPKGWKLHWNMHATHNNPECFPEPENFDPRRFEGTGPAPYTFVPFGGGVRMCPGKEYARALILVFVHNLVRRFRLEKLSPEDDHNLTSSPAGLRIRLLPRHPQA